jgi:hypothetical protein
VQLLLDRLQSIDFVLEPSLLGLHGTLLRFAFRPRLLEERFGVQSGLSAELGRGVLLGLALRPRLLEKRILRVV